MVRYQWDTHIASILYLTCTDQIQRYELQLSKREMSSELVGVGWDRAVNVVLVIGAGRVV